MVIYKITNVINNKVYIGQTTKCPKIRFKCHCKNKRYKSIIKKAIDKYGKDNFKLEVIDKADNIDGLNELERYYIWKYQSANKKYGYNIEFGGKNSILSKETRLKISKSKTGKKINRSKGQELGIIKARNACKKPIICLNINKTYLSITDAANELNLRKTGINAVLTGKCDQTGGYKFKYVDEKLNKKADNFKKYRKHKYIKRIEKIKANAGKYRIKNIKCSNGIIYNSISDAAKELKLKTTNICKVLKNTRNHTGGYKFEYINKDK